MLSAVTVSALTLVALSGSPWLLVASDSRSVA